jgi:hypothetical protein
LNSSISELIASAAVGGIITGIIVPTVGEWLKGYFNGYHATKKRNRDKLITIDFIRTQSDPDDSALSNPTTNQIQSKLFPRKKFGYVYELLHELQREGRINVTYVNTENWRNETWHYVSPTGKQYYA